MTVIRESKTPECQERRDNLVQSRLQKLKQGRWQKIEESVESKSREGIADTRERARRRQKLKERTTEGCLAASGDMLPVASAPAKITSELLGWDLLFKWDDGWALGVITHVGMRKNLWNSEITYPLYPPDDRVRDHFLDINKYSTEEDAEVGSWVLIR
jgi:hypothetical protein